MSRTLDAVHRALFALSLIAGCPCIGTAQPAAVCPGPSCPAGSSQAARTVQRKQEFASAVGRFAEGLWDVRRDRRAIQRDIDSMGQALEQWDAAIHDLDGALGQPRGADEHVTLGTAYLERHRLDDALSEFDQAAADQPARADVHLLMSVTLRRAARPADAALAIQRAATLGSPDPGTLYAIASNLAGMGLPKEAAAARATLRASLASQLNRTPPPVAVPRAVDAPTPLLRLESTTPVFSPVLYAPGFALIARGAYAEALVRFREAAAADSLTADRADAPDDLAKGRAAMRAADLSSALTRLEAAIAAAPTNAEAHRVLGVAYVIDGQGGRGLERFTAAIRLDPRDERAWMALADLLATVGQFPETERVLTGALQVLAGSGQAHFGLGRLYRALGRYADAARELEAAAASGAAVEGEALRRLMEDTYVTLASFDRAAEMDAARLAIDPNNVHAHRRLGDAYLRQDRDDDALTEFMVSLLLDARDPAVYGSMAQIHLRAGRYAEAADASRRALDIDPSLKEARYSLGTALMRLGRADEGVTQLEAYRRLQVEATDSGRRQHELERLKRDASVAIAGSDYATAVGLLRQAGALVAEPATWLALGFALMQTGHHGEAIVELQKAGQLEDDPNVHRYLAEAYRATGRADESRAEAQTYLQMVERAKRTRLQTMSGQP